VYQLKATETVCGMSQKKRSVNYAGDEEGYIAYEQQPFCLKHSFSDTVKNSDTTHLQTALE
jgi:hypothetical protein